MFFLPQFTGLFRKTNISAGYDVDAQAWFDAVLAAGSSISDANKSAVSAFVAGCKTDGNWTPIKQAGLLCAADDLTGALVSLKGSNPTNVNFVSGDYSRTTGLVGNGSTKYLATGRAGNADPQDNCSLGVYVHTAKSVGTSCVHIGNYSAGVNSKHAFEDASTTGYRMCSSTYDSVAGTNYTGLIGASRAASGSFNLRVNGTTTAKTRTSGTPLSTSIDVFHANGLAGFYSAARLSFWWSGEAVDLAALEARLETLMAALS